MTFYEYIKNKEINETEVSQNTDWFNNPNNPQSSGLLSQTIDTGNRDLYIRKTQKGFYPIHGDNTPYQLGYGIPFKWFDNYEDALESGRRKWDIRVPMYNSLTSKR